MRQIPIALVLLIIPVAALLAQSPEANFQQANMLYQQGKVAEAAELYENILKSGVVSGELYYNLGNAYYKSGNIPRAILMYERALRLIPSDDDLRHNLQLANLMITDRIEPAPKLFIWESWDDLKNLFSFAAATWLLYAGYVLVILCVGAVLLARSYALRKMALMSGVVSAIVFLAFLVIFLAKRADLGRSDEAVLQQQIVTVKNSPDDSSSDAFVLHGGVKVQIVDRVGQWVKIRLADGKVGWMQSTAADII